MSALYTAALAAHDAGLCVLPPKEDGSKAPDAPAWKRYQESRSTCQDIDAWYASGHRSGIGIVTGTVSGRLELFDFDDRETYETFVALARAAGLGDLVERIEAGYLEASPGGMHWLYRCTTIAGNTKLARRADDAGEIAVLIETRGEGGYVVVAPSNGRVHPDGGVYRLLRGGVGTIATITPEERAELHNLARSLDQMPKEEARASHADSAGTSSGKPGDDYNERGDVLALLEAHNWTIVFERGGITHLRRPGKDRGTSATFGIGAGGRLFYPFTTSTVFDAEQTYTPFAVYATLEHGGDFTAAARALAEQGYGEPAARIVRGTGASAGHGAEGDRPWPVLDPAALHGLAGDIVAAIAPHTEGDPVAILTNFIVMFGSAVGRSPHARVGATRHGINEFAVQVGKTSRGRKGTAYHEVRRLFERADAEWCGLIAGGLSSGEGLIHAVRDPIWKPNKDGEMKLADPGVEDKRLLALEPEFSVPLRVASREGNTLSEQVRRAYDGDDLRTMTRNSPLRATRPHIAVMGHITVPELVRELTETAQLNGFGNRFAFFCVKRSKLLPHGGALPEAEVSALARRVQEALHAARKRGEVRRDAEADRMWEAVYPALTADRPGMLGALTARGEAHVLRYSLLYALLDDAPAIGAPHLLAALALWEYAEQSAAYIFGDATGDPVADQILTALRRSGKMTQTQISDLFARNQKAGKIERALQALLGAGLVRTWQGDSTSGRPPVYWEAV